MPDRYVLRFFEKLFGEVRSVTTPEVVFAVAFALAAYLYQWLTGNFTDVLSGVIPAFWIACGFGCYYTIKAAVHLRREELSKWTSYRSPIHLPVQSQLRPSKPSPWPGIVTTAILCCIFLALVVVTLPSKVQSLEKEPLEAKSPLPSGAKGLDSVTATSPPPSPEPPVQPPSAKLPQNVPSAVNITPILVLLSLESDPSQQKPMLTDVLLESLRATQTKWEFSEARGYFRLRFILEYGFAFYVEASTLDGKPLLVDGHEHLPLGGLKHYNANPEAAATGREVAQFIRETVRSHSKEIDEYLDKAQAKQSTGLILANP